MLYHYLLLAVRCLRRRPVFGSLGIASLALGLAAAVCVGLWVHMESSWDQDHDDPDRIFRVLQHRFGSDGSISTRASVSYPLFQELATNHPEVEAAVLLGWESDLSLKVGEKTFQETGRNASASVVDVLSIQMLAGDGATLDVPGSLLLSRRLAEKYFGPDWLSRHDVLGHPVVLDGSRERHVTGIYENIAPRSYFKPEWLASASDLVSESDGWIHSWTNTGIRIVLKLRPGADAAAFSQKIAGLDRRFAPEATTEPFLQPLTDAHLRAEFTDGHASGGRIDTVRALAGVGLLVMLLGCINFINLMTAGSMVRGREIGVRKALGGTRLQVGRQFLTEALLMGALSGVLAMVLLVVIRPWLTDLTGYVFPLGGTFAVAALSILPLSLVTGMAAGIYPAFRLASLGALETLRSRTAAGRDDRRFQSILVGTQFALAAGLLVLAGTSHRQMAFIQSADVGMDYDHVLVLPIDGTMKESWEAFEEAVKRSPAIVDVARASQDPMNVGRGTNRADWEGKAPDDNTSFWVLEGSENLATLLGMSIVEGRTFEAGRASDSLGVLLNETALRAMGVRHPVGTRFGTFQGEGEVVGVVGDFHHASLHGPIAPLMIRLETDTAIQALIRVDPEHTAEALSHLESTFRTWYPASAFQPWFMDEAYREAYEQDRAVGRLANGFTLLAIVIAWLGLVGMAIHATDRRLVELSLRRVLGARTDQVIGLMVRPLLGTLSVAMLVGAVPAFWLAAKWLDTYAYHTEIPLPESLVSTALLAVVAGATMASRIIIVLRQRPADVLRGS